MPLLDILPRAAVRGALWVSALVLAGCASLGTDAPSGADPATAARGPAPIAGAQGASVRPPPACGDRHVHPILFRSGRE